MRANWMLLTALSMCLVSLSTYSPGAISASRIRIAYNLADSRAAERLAHILQEPKTYEIALELIQERFTAKSVKELGDPDLFLFMTLAHAVFLSFDLTGVANSTIANSPGPTIQAVTLSNYGDKTIDDSAPAQGKWARKAISAGSTDFQVTQTYLLFKAMGLRCVDQASNAQDSVICQPNYYWDQPDYLMDRRNGTEAFFVWGEQCEPNVKRVYQLRPNEFRLIPITPGIVGKLRAMSQLPYVTDQIALSSCTNKKSDSANWITTATLLNTVLKSNPSANPEAAAFIARETGRFLVKYYKIPELKSAVGIVNNRVPLSPTTAAIYENLGFFK